jgi:hypothetical protein
MDKDDIKTLIDSLSPTYETILPVSGKTVLFIPFKVKDAKNISIILNEQNKKLSLIAMVNLLKANTKGINIEELCLADAEYLYLKIRSKSVGELINIKIGEEKYNINIDDIKCRNTPTEQNLLIKDGVYAVIKTPQIKTILNSDFNDEHSVLKKYIHTIIIKNEIFNLSTFVPDTLKELIENLPYSLIKDIQEISKKQPELYFSIPAKDGEREVSGTLNFFTWLQTS